MHERECAALPVLQNHELCNYGEGVARTYKKVSVSARTPLRTTQAGQRRQWIALQWAVMETMV